MTKISPYNLATEDRALAAWEIASVVASVLIGEWVVFALAGDGALALLLAVAAALIGAGWYTSSLDFLRWKGGASIFGVPALGLLWGPLQQYALQGFINR